MSKKFKITLSGVGNDAYHDGQLACRYIYASSSDTGFSDISGVHNPPTYEEILENKRADSPVYLCYQDDEQYNLKTYEGVYALVYGGNEYSIYRREYQIYEKYSLSSMATEEKIYIGDWVPVAINNTQTVLRDYNITAGRTYQYILYPENTDQVEQFANSVEFLEESSPISEETRADYKSTGIPIQTFWDEWSLTELVPIENAKDTPALKKSYRADLNNVWLFKYSLQTGSQTQTFQKNEIQTLGQYSKYGYGRANAVSGEVSCLLGSEIVPCTSFAYIERMRSTIRTPLSTNDKIFMLKEWRKIAFSPNPKLLKDIKGQSWIVQIISNSNTPQNFYKNQPDTISFSWKQIDSTDNVVITGDGSSSPTPGQIDSIWYKKKII